MKKHGMGLPYSIHGSDEACMQNFSRNTVRNVPFGRTVLTLEYDIKIDFKIGEDLLYIAQVVSGGGFIKTRQ
jgi:hypothetical protein